MSNTPEAFSPGHRLKEVVRMAKPLLEGLNKEAFLQKPIGGGWSKIEILGHLIDSACNNHRRFVLAAHQDDLHFDGYVQDQWVSAQPYHQMEYSLLIQLWVSYNIYISELMDYMSEDLIASKTDKHNFDQIAFRTVPKGSPTNLGYLLTDYIDHLEHHLHQILHATE